MPDHKYKISPKANAQAEALGFAGDIVSRLNALARTSARYSHPEGNRRCENYLLRVVNDQIEAVHQFDPKSGELLSK